MALYNPYNITAWTAYTPTITSTTGSVTNSTSSAYWSRVGDSIEISGVTTFSSTSSAFTGFRFSLPSGLTLDESKIPAVTCGIATINNTGTNIFYGNIERASGTTFIIFCQNSSATYLEAANITEAVPFTFNSTDTIMYRVSRVPIVGWGP